MKATETQPRRRTALITGAARGLGRATALRLAAENCHVWLAVREIRSAHALLAQVREAGGSADVLAMDVTNQQQIAAAVQEIAQRHGQLDILVNNAGVMLDGGWMGNTAVSVDSAVLRKTFDANFFGAVAVVQAMWPLLKNAGHANVVNVSSFMGSNTIHADPEGPLAGAKPFAYDASKAALNAFTTHLAEVGRSVGIQVNSAHPGWVRTELGTEHATLSIDEGVQTIVELALLHPGSRSGRFEHLGEPIPW